MNGRTNGMAAQCPRKCCLLSGCCFRLVQELGAHAVTLNAYMGWDTVEPFLKDPAKGVFVLCKVMVMMVLLCVPCQCTNHLVKSPAAAATVALLVSVALALSVFFSYSRSRQLHDTRHLRIYHAADRGDDVHRSLLKPVWMNLGQSWLRVEPNVVAFVSTTAALHQWFDFASSARTNQRRVELL